MKKVLKILLGIVLVLIIGFSAFLSIEINKSVTNIVPQEETLKNEGKFLQTYNINADDFKENYAYRKEIVTNDKDGYDFSIDTYELDGKRDIFIFIHGMGGTGETMLPHSQIFLERGFSAVLYDQRNSGTHPIKKNNMGVGEKGDLINVVYYLKEKYPDRKINIFAESYGAHTFLHGYEQIKDKIQLVILDSPMANGEEFIDQGLKEASNQTNIPFGLMKSLGNIGSKVIEGYGYKETNGLLSFNKIDNPILIITNKEDKVTPFSHAQGVFDKSGKDRVMLLNESEHTQMYFNEREKYIKGIEDFLSKYN
ncbi:alpha/beta fold hydrolase [Lagierella sp.]|uniref:alpha/beta hydrolase n=1 Tax=Lagierella sp. TaxID=2849657 RepID=UPI00260FEC86|nr:alpha/beta fold hydrolase [Lagierella sp.]